MKKEVKAIVRLKHGETIQHPSGVLEKVITREMLEKNPQKYAYSHPTFYENAAELQRHYSLNAKVQNANGRNERVQMAEINGTKTAVFVGNGSSKAIGRDKKIVAQLLNKIQNQQAQQKSLEQKAAPKKSNRKNQNNNEAE